MDNGKTNDEFPYFKILVLYFIYTASYILIWFIGLIFYFAYGIRYSKESTSGKNNDGGYVLLQTMKTSSQNEEKSPQVCPTRTD